MKPTHTKSIVAGFMLLWSPASSFAGCPHSKYGALYVDAMTAAKIAGEAKGEDRCPRLARLVDAERRLLTHLEDYAVICVINPDVHDVHTRRLSEVRKLFGNVCGANSARE